MKNSTAVIKGQKEFLVGLCGQNILYGIITSSLAYYMQFTILIPSFWVGIILSTARIFDAVKDPFAGAFISKKASRTERYLRLLPLPTAALTVLCFVNGIYNAEKPNYFIIAIAFASYILWEIVFTLTDIPLTALPELIAENGIDKKKLLALRPIGSMACSVCMLVLQPIAFALAGSFSGARAEQYGFLIIVSALSIIGGVMFHFSMSGIILSGGVQTQVIKNPFKLLFKNPILKRVLLSGVLGSAKSTAGVVMTALVNYYFANKDPQKIVLYTFLLGAGNFFGMIISMPLAPKLSQKYGSRKAYIYVNAVNAATNTALFVFYLFNKQSMTQVAPMIFMFLMLTVIGICLSVSTAIQTFFISDAVDLEKRTTGSNPSALFFSCNTFLVKIASGVSSLIVSIGYKAIGFSSAQAERINAFVASGGIPRLSSEYASLMTLLFFLFTVPMAVGSLLSAVVFLNKDEYVG